MVTFFCPSWYVRDVGESHGLLTKIIDNSLFAACLYRNCLAIKQILYLIGPELSTYIEAYNNHRETLTEC